MVMAWGSLPWDGGSFLYYNKAFKLYTTNTGACVCGTITSDGHTTAGDISASGGLSAYNGYFVDKVGIGTNNPGEKLHVDGNICVKNG